MSRVSESLYNGNVNKPKTTGATNDELAERVRNIITALRAAGVLKKDTSGDEA